MEKTNRRIFPTKKKKKKKLTKNKNKFNLFSKNVYKNEIEIGLVTKKFAEVLN